MRLAGKFDFLHDNNKLVEWSFLEINILCNWKIMNPITKMYVANMSAVRGIFVEYLVSREYLFFIV